MGLLDRKAGRGFGRAHCEGLRTAPRTVLRREKRISRGKPCHDFEPEPSSPVGC
jgi:hypothetical protein